MQDMVLAKLADRLARRHHIDQHRIARQHALERLGVGFVDLLHASSEPPPAESRVLAQSPQSAPASFVRYRPSERVRSVLTRERYVLLERFRRFVRMGSSYRAGRVWQCVP